MVALAILAVAMTVGAEALSWSAALRKQADQRQLALQEAINCLEQVRQLPWDQLTEDGLAKLELSAIAHKELAAPQLSIVPEKVNSGPDAIRVRVQIEWQSRYRQAPCQVELTTWRYRVPAAE
jgi:hypothetical protein